MMAAKNDAGLNKGGFMLFKRIGRISELAHWAIPSDDAQNCSWDRPARALQPHSSRLMVIESWREFHAAWLSRWESWYQEKAFFFFKWFYFRNISGCSDSWGDISMSDRSSSLSKTSPYTVYSKDERWNHCAKWKKSDTEGQYCIIPFIRNVQNRQICRQSRWVVARGQVGEEWVQLLNRHRDFCCSDGMI